MQRARLPYLLIPIAALIAIIPLLLHGCSCGHDFDFHLLNWFEAAHQFLHGHLHPHWAFTPAFNAGEPRFVFYPPLSWSAGALLGILFPWTWTPILYTWLALTACGLALYRLARDFATPTAALLAAVLYMANPYMLFTAYERTAFAELLAAAWIPLLLHAILRKQVTIPRIAIPIALLWLTNAPAAVMSCYALALLAAVRLATNSSNQLQLVASNNGIATKPGAPYLDSEMWASRESATVPAHINATHTPTQTRLQIALTTLAGAALGFGLAAIYILPAAYERRFVHIDMAIIPFYRIQDNFLFHHTTDIDHDKVLHTASLIAVLLIILTFAILAVILIRRYALNSATNPDAPSSARSLRLRWASRVSATNHRHTLYALATLTIAITLLLTPLTAFIWNHAPELAFLQFPWRLLAILAAVLALAIALVLTPLKLKPTAATALTLAIAAALIFPAYHLFLQTCDPEDTINARLALFRSNLGSDPTDEYTPITADNDALSHSNPPYWLSSDPNAKAPADSPGPAPTHLAFKLTAPQDLILNLRNYPPWRVTINRTPVATRLPRSDGLIAIPVPAGFFAVDITYAEPRDQTLSDMISLVSFVILIFLIRYDYRRFHTA